MPDISKLINDDPSAGKQGKSKTVVKTEGVKPESSGSDDSLSLRGKQSVKVNISELNIGENSRNSSQKMTEQTGSPQPQQAADLKQSPLPS